MFTVRHFAFWAALALGSVACDKAAPQATAQPLGVAGAPTLHGTHPSPAPKAAPQAAEPSVDGSALYQKYCALCHAKDGTGYAADNAPSLVSPGFLESANDGLIAWWIRMGRPGTAMASYAKQSGGPLSEKEIQAVVKFLRSKGPAYKAPPSRRASGDGVAGAELYAKHCVTCHGTKAERGKAPMLYNPEFLRSATHAFLHYSISKGRAGTTMPPFEKTLSETDIDNIAVHLRSNMPGYRPPAPEVDLKELAKIPVVMNPSGKSPQFTLRENRFVPVDEVKKAWDAKQRLVIIDARAASDFVSGHITGAISNPYYEKTTLTRIPKDGTWVLAYCACPHHASGEVVDELRRLGYKNTAIIDEGILVWQKRGYPMEGHSVQSGSPQSGATQGGSVDTPHQGHEHQGHEHH